MNRITGRLGGAAAGLLALLAFAAPAGAASADTDTYSAELYLSLNHKRTGLDTSISGIHWTRETNMRAQVKTLASGIEFVEGRKLPGPSPLDPAAVYGTNVDDLIVMTVDGGIQTTTCVNVAEGYASPGQISFRPAKVDGRPGFEVVVKPFNTFQVNAACTGFSSASGIFDFSSDVPVATAKLPRSAVGSRIMRTKVEGTAPCPVTAQTEATTSCDSRWFGQLTLELTGSSGGGKGQPVGGEAGPTGDPMVDAVIAQIDRQLGKATVKVPCPRACGGKVSAYAVARKKRLASNGEKPRLLGNASLSSPKRGGIGRATLAFDRADRKAMRELGAVEFRVTARKAGGGKPVRGKVTVAVPGR